MTWPADAKDIGPNWQPIPDMPGHYISTRPSDELEKLFSPSPTPETRALIQSVLDKNARVIPVEPNVKSAKTCKLFNAGVSEKSKTEKSADPTCYNVVTVNETGLFDIVGERPMTNAQPRVEESHADEWEKIEAKHFGRCIWQSILPSRSVMVEMLEVHRERGGFATAIVVKHFDRQIPRSGSSKPWPKHTGTYVYLEAQDGNRWDGLDKLLTEFRSK